jgi:ketosteroid isomerase-like protein
MGDAASAEAVARKLVHEYNKGSADWVDACHDASTQWVELPFLGGPGRSGGFKEVRAAAELQVANFPDRRMEVLSVIASDHAAALEVEWTGTAAKDTAWASAGKRLRLRGVLLLTIAGGKVVKEVDYVIPMP